MAANAEARKNFTRLCVKLIRNYNFDGIDLGESIDCARLHFLQNGRV